MRSFLVVEDSEDMRTFYELLIKKQYKCANIDFAKNGKEALEKVLNCNYSIIISDIYMPVMDGISFYKLLKEKRPSMVKKVAFISASIIEPHISYFKHEGCSFLRKPFEINKFYNIVQQILGDGEEAWTRKDSIGDLRHFDRFKMKKKCTLIPLDNTSYRFETICAETTDYSKSGLGLKYKEEEIPSGVILRILSKDMTNLKERGKVIWSYCQGSHNCRSGIQWVNH